MADPKPNIGNIIPTGLEDGEVPSGNLTAPSSKRTRAEEFLSLLVIPPLIPYILYQLQRSLIGLLWNLFHLDVGLNMIIICLSIHSLQMFI